MLIDSEFSLPFKIPYSEHNKFTGRELFLRQLDLALRSREHRSRPLVLYGTGGVGKTEIVIEYAHRHQKEYSSIFWINATSLSSTYDSLREVFGRIVRHYGRIFQTPDGLPDRARIFQLLLGDDKIVSANMVEGNVIAEAIKDWLTREGNYDWLLVFDNYDDIKAYELHNFFPGGSGGSIIVTSRRMNLGRAWEGLEVEDLSVAEGLQLLKRSAVMHGELSREGKQHGL